MRPYLLLFCLTIPFVGKTQTLSNDKQQDLLGKGHINVGVSVGQGYRGTYPTTTFVSPRIQYFILDGWSVAAEARYLVSNIYPQTVNKPDYRLKGGGLSTRYYFGYLPTFRENVSSANGIALNFSTLEAKVSG